MADNLGYTPGTGATVSTEEVTTLNGSAVSAQHLQRVVLATRTADSTAADCAIDTAAGDNESNADFLLLTAAREFRFNGTSWDRARGTTATFKCATYTTAQTGVALWTPAAGRAVAVTALQIQSYGTTAGLCQIWFGGSADTTYTRGTDAPLFDGEFAPSTTSKPGVYVTYPIPCRGAADFVLRVTTTNAQSVTVTVWGYEI